MAKDSENEYEDDSSSNSESCNESTDTDTTGYVDTHPDIITALNDILPAFVNCLDREQEKYVSENPSSFEQHIKYNTAQQTTINPCLACSKECSLQCSGCRVVHFCNRECQKSAWKHHKAFCKSVKNPTVSSHKNTDDADDPRQTCVIIDGFFGANWDDTIKSREQLLLCGMDVIYINGTKGGKTLPNQVASLLLQSSSSTSSPPNAMLFWGFGSGGDDVYDDVSDQFFYESSHFKAAVISWCANGGRFIVQGERTEMMGNWPMWFDKPWKDSDYYRTDHKCFAVSMAVGNDDRADADADGTAANHHWCKWYKESDGAVVSTYNVKACMLENVDPTEVLFGTTDDSQSSSLVPSMSGHRIEKSKTAVAFGKYGSGTVSFFGDVHHEHATIQIMTVIARGEAAVVNKNHGIKN